MALHLAEISLAVAPGAHAVVLMDQAGWHTTDKLEVPNNISIIALRFQKHLILVSTKPGAAHSNRVFTSYDNIADHCCEAWNKLIDQPWHIMTIGRRKWAHGS